jgi:YVTN family beta-propeller protein
MRSSPDAVLAVANTFYESIDLFDFATGELLATVSGLLAQPHELAADTDNRRLFVSHTYRHGAYGTGAEPGHEISVLDVDARAVFDVIDIRPFVAPHGVQYRASTGLVYAGVERSDAGNGVLLVDADQRTIVDHIPTDAPNTHWVAVTADGRRGYASHKDAPFISVLDLHARKAVATVPLSGGAEELDLSVDDRYLYVVTPHQTTPAQADHPPSRLVKIDTDTLNVVAEVPLQPANSAVRAGHAGAIYVSRMTPTGRPFGSAPGALHVIDGTTMTLRATIPLDRESFTIREAPDGRTVCVSNGASDTVSVVDVETLDVIRTLTVTRQDETPLPFGGTHGLAFV